MGNKQTNKPQFTLEGLRSYRGVIIFKYGGLLSLTKPVMFKQRLEGGGGFGKGNEFHVKALWVG